MSNKFYRHMLKFNISNFILPTSRVESAPFEGFLIVATMATCCWFVGIATKARGYLWISQTNGFWEVDAAMARAEASVLLLLQKSNLPLSFWLSPHTSFETLEQLIQWFDSIFSLAWFVLLAMLTSWSFCSLDYSVEHRNIIYNIAAVTDIDALLATAVQQWLSVLGND